MKITFLGTAAYDGFPSLFCNCETCKKAFRLGGKDLRTRTQALIDDYLLIEFNPDTVSHFLKYRWDWNKVTNCLITHSHSDHFYIEDMMISQYAHKVPLMHYYCGLDGYNQMIKAFNQNKAMKGKALPHLVEPLKKFVIKDYEVLPLRAHHDETSSPLMYAIKKGDKKMLYAHDSGDFFKDTLSALKDFGTLDLISIDCTGGTDKGNWNHHMCLEQVINHLKIFKTDGIIDDKTIIVVNHFSHNGKATHQDMLDACEPYGIIVAYDGLSIEF